MQCRCEPGQLDQVRLQLRRGRWAMNSAFSRGRLTDGLHMFKRKLPLLVIVLQMVHMSAVASAGAAPTLCPPDLFVACTALDLSTTIQGRTGSKSRDSLFCSVLVGSF
jgi:hypothetical protein